VTNFLRRNISALKDTVIDAARIPLDFGAWALRKTLYLCASVFLLACAATALCAERESGIVDYRPTDFRETANTPFFYTIDNQLKHGVSIDPDAPTLFSGKGYPPERTARKSTQPGPNPPEGAIYVYPSPDNRKAAVVSDDKLYLIEPGKAPILLLENIEGVGQPRSYYFAISFGLFTKPYYRSETLQWSADSRYIHIAQDDESIQAGQLYGTGTSQSARLYRIDAKGPTTPEKIADGFQVFFTSYASRYFFIGEENTVCFLGSFVRKWICVLPEGIFAVKSYSEDEIVLENGRRLTGRQFVSVDHHQNARKIWRGGKY
jgi:hypothetical protein